VKRTNVVKLVVDKNIHEKLKELAIVTAKCWNEVNWLRMQQFKKGGRVDFTKTEKEVYEKYKHVLKVNAQQVARKNAEDWRSFFSLIKEKKEGKLPKWFKPRPPGYWKDKSGKYKLMIVIRNDRYEVDENERTIYLKDFKLVLRFKGKLKWHEKQGRVEIIYDEARRSWYAHMPIEVESGAKVEVNLKASVDLGIVNLATVCIEDGTWYIFKGGSVLSQYEYYSKKISEVQKVLARHEQKRRRKLKLLYSPTGVLGTVRLLPELGSETTCTDLRAEELHGVFGYLKDRTRVFYNINLKKTFFEPILGFLKLFVHWYTE